MFVYSIRLEEHCLLSGYGDQCVSGPSPWVCSGTEWPVVTKWVGASGSGIVWKQELIYPTLCQHGRGGRCLVIHFNCKNSQRCAFPEYCTENGGLANPGIRK